MDEPNVQALSKRCPSRTPDRCDSAGAESAFVEWQKRLFRNSYTRDGQRFSLDGWCVKIQHRGRRRTFSLGIKSKEEAAAEAKAIYESILTEGWEAALEQHAARNETRNVLPKSKAADYWKDRLLVRRYQFPASNPSENDLAARIDYAGSNYWFPLGTSAQGAALARAQQIRQALIAEGWESVCSRFSRELIIGFEWCSNPILWTYTTVHSVVSSLFEHSAVALETGRRRVLLVESDAGIRRALQWCVNQHPGFAAVPCEAAESFNHAFAIHKPQLVLLNRKLAEPLRFATPGRISKIQKGVSALTYSVAADGDQLFASTPGGADGYLLKRVKPTSIFEPILKNSGSTGLSVNEIDRNVRNYFKESLLPRLNMENGALAQLTAREQEVLALMSKGCVDKEIAQALGISAWTVHGHIKKIFERLRVRTRTEAVVRYLEK